MQTQVEQGMGTADHLMHLGDWLSHKEVLIEDEEEEEEDKKSKMIRSKEGFEEEKEELENWNWNVLLNSRHSSYKQINVTELYRVQNYYI